MHAASAADCVTQQRSMLELQVGAASSGSQGQRQEGAMSRGEGGCLSAGLGQDGGEGKLQGAANRAAWHRPDHVTDPGKRAGGGQGWPTAAAAPLPATPLPCRTTRTGDRPTLRSGTQPTGTALGAAALPA